MLLCFGNFVVAMCLPADVHLGPGQTCVGVYRKCLECSGTEADAIPEAFTAICFGTVAIATSLAIWSNRLFYRVG